MPAWMEKIKKTFASKADLKSLFVELQPDNRIHSFTIVPYDLFDPVSFPSFLSVSARIAMENEFIPDNLLLRFDGIPEKELPSSDDMFAKEPVDALRFIASHGGITDENTIPLRKAAYLEAQQREVTKENLQELEHSTGYQRFAAHEEAMEKIAVGKPAKFFFTIAETDQGTKVFNDGLTDNRNFRNYLQTQADQFFSESLQGVESLRIYRIESSSRQLLELSKDTQNQSLPSYAGRDILKNYIPSVAFDMRPTGENLDRFITANALELSTHNWNIMTLQDIADRGYAHLLTDESFAYKKEFAPIDKGIREITRQRDAQRDYPFEKKMDELQITARSMAQTLLNMGGIRKENHPIPPTVMASQAPDIPKEKPAQKSVREQDKKAEPPKNKQPKEAIKGKATSRKRQIKPKL